MNVWAIVLTVLIVAGLYWLVFASCRVAAQADEQMKRAWDERQRERDGR